LAGHLALPNHDVSSYAIALSPDENMLATGGASGVIVLYAADTLAEIARFGGHRGSVDALGFSLSSEWLYSGGSDETLRRWPAGEVRRIVTAPRSELVKALSSRRPAGDEQFDIAVREYRPSILPAAGAARLPLTGEQ
jgi:WD40 repeat protein